MQGGRETGFSLSNLWPLRCPESQSSVHSVVSVCVLSVPCATRVCPFRSQSSGTQVTRARVRVRALRVRVCVSLSFTVKWHTSGTSTRMGARSAIVPCDG